MEPEFPPETLTKRINVITKALSKLPEKKIGLMLQHLTKSGVR
jgi:hypothetical protein